MKTRMYVVQLVNTHIPVLYAKNIEVGLVMNKEAITVEFSYYNKKLHTLSIFIMDNKDKEAKLKFLAEFLYLIENHDDTERMILEAISRYYKQHVI